jgi:hypothetical protein
MQDLKLKNDPLSNSYSWNLLKWDQAKVFAKLKTQDIWATKGRKNVPLWDQQVPLL